jgi:hypothetical protein
MTKLELTIRQVSDLRDFYLKIKEEKIKKHKAGATRRSSRPAKPAAER